MTEHTVHVAAEALAQFTREIFTAKGVPAADAETVARVLVWANARGMDSHGVLRVPNYAHRIDNGESKPVPDMKVVTETPAAQVVDVDHALGPVGMRFAMERAIESARKVSIGWVQVRNATHMGAIGYYARMAADADMAGLVIGASVPNMAFHGARAAGVATSPIAIAVPGGEHASLMLDMGTAEISIGKLAYARDAGLTLPENCALDDDGNPTTDAMTAVLPMPLGGAKGSGLALMFECLTSLMVANPLVETKITGTNTSHRQNALCIAVDIAAFTDVAGYKAQIDAMIAALKTLPTAAGIDEILVPGERGDHIKAVRDADGIPLPRGTWDRLAALAERLGVDLPAVG